MSIIKELGSERKEKSQLVFVYGSLKRGLHNNSVLGSSKYIGRAETMNKYGLRSLGSFPGVDITVSTTIIQGEVFEVTDEAVLRDLDSLEGYPEFYDKKEVEVLMDIYGTIKKATMYYLAEPSRYKGTLLSSGFWEQEQYLTQFFSAKSSKL